MLKNHNKEFKLSGRDTLFFLKNMINTIIDVVYGYLPEKPGWAVHENYSFNKSKVIEYRANGIIHGVIPWDNHGTHRTDIDYVDLYSKMENISIPESIQQLALKLKINHKLPLEHQNVVSIKNFVESPMDWIQLADERATRTNSLPIAKPHGGNYYLIDIYKTESGKVIHYPLCNRLDTPNAQNPVLIHGFCPKNIPLSGLNLLEKYRTAKVLLVDDIYLAHEINTLFSWGSENAPDVVAVSVWAGTSRIHDYNFTPLYGRDVIFLPTLSKESIVAGIKLKEMLDRAVIESFKVLMTPVHDETWDRNACKISCGEYAVEKAIKVTTSNILILRDDLKVAWKFKRYKKYLEDEGLIESNSADTKPSSCFRSVNQIMESAKKEGTGLSRSLDNILAPGKLSVFVGDTDTGKTMLMRGLSVAVATENSFLTLEKGQKRNVYIINFELNDQESSAYTLRTKAAFNIDFQQNLDVYDWILQGTELPEEVTSTDVLDKSMQDYILKNIEPNSIVIFDNLLASSTRDINRKEVAQELIEFVRRLQNKMAALIIVHHTGKKKGKKSEAMGTSALKSLAQNYITLHEVEGPCNGGVNTKLTFEKIKSYPKLKGEEFQVRLPYAEPGEQGGPWEFISMENQDIERQAPAPTDSVTEAEEPEKHPTLKPDTAGLPKIQQEALNIAYENGRITKKDLMDAGHKEGTVKDNLKQLTDAGKLRQNETGRRTFYTLPQLTK